MTASAIAVHTDATKDGKPLIGLAFDSIGRYGHGALLRERFIPRLLAADPRRLCGRQRRHRSDKAWAVADAQREARRARRATAARSACWMRRLWDLAAKSADEPLWAYLARDTDGRAPATGSSIYASGGHYRPAHDIEALCDDVRARDRAQGHRRFKIKIGGAPLSRRPAGASRRCSRCSSPA